MAYQVTVLESAAKEIRKLTPSVLQRIIPRIKALGDNPRPDGCKKLKGNNKLYRIRVGDYRILYGIEDDIQIVEVTAVRHRREAYE